MSKKAVPQCVDCGGDSIQHGLTYFSIVIDGILSPIFRPGPITRYLSRGIYRFTDYLTPHILSLLVHARLAQKIEDHDDQTLLLAMVLWEEAKVRNIPMWEFRLFGLPRNIFVATLPNGKLISFEGIPQPASVISRVWWMDNKAELKREFRKRGLPIAKGGDARTERQALKIYRTLTPPVIIKPHSGSGSRHTILHIDTEEELIRAFRIAKIVSPYVIVEEELVGPVYRATVVDGVFAAALRRDPPSVVGDGTHTVEELIEEANKNPARSGPYFSKLKIDDKAHKELEWQELTPTSIPAEGRRVMLHQKVNWGLGGTTADVTDTVHPDNIALFERVAKELHAPIVGIDFIIADMTRSWKEQERCGILECNSMPFFDNHHLPFEGKVQNVASYIWNMVEAS